MGIGTSVRSLGSVSRLGAALAAALFHAFLVSAADRVEVPVADSPVLGPADAPVTIVEFIDFQ